jgi:hypothetical protein
VGTASKNEQLLGAGEKMGNTVVKAGLNVPAAGPGFTANADLTKTINDPLASAEAKGAAATKLAYYKQWGYDSDYSGRGYSCHPATGGYCYIRCDGGASDAKAPNVTKMLEVKDPNRVGVTRPQPWPFVSENRCGGLELLGYKCLPTSVRPNKQRVCLRECTTRSTAQFNEALCSFPVNARGPDEGPKPYAFGEFQREADVLNGQTCVALSNATACQWNPDFEPRHPDQSLNLPQP